MRTAIAGAVVAAAALAGCSASASPKAAQTGAQAHSAAPAPTVGSATELRQAAKAEFDAYAAGQYGQAWDLWSAHAKTLISRADYEKLHAECRDSAAGVPITIEAVTVTGPTASVRISRLGFLAAYTFRWDGGHWRFEPKPADAADYRLGVTALVAKDRTAGFCGK
jgi:hypothetical protein